jgi:hypothetical protein
LLRNSSTNRAGAPAWRNVKVSRENATFPAAMPAAAKRSITLLSMPQVIGLTKPAGGAGV